MGMAPRVTLHVVIGWVDSTSLRNVPEVPPSVKGDYDGHRGSIAHAVSQQSLVKGRSVCGWVQLGRERDPAVTQQPMDPDRVCLRCQDLISRHAPEGG